MHEGKLCRDCRGTGWNGGRAGRGACKFCGGSGYHDQPRVDTPAKLARALAKQRGRSGGK